MKRRSEKPDASRQGSGRSKSGATTRTVLGAVNAGRELTKRIDVRWKWHYCVLLSLRERLLRERCERLSEAAQPLETHSMDLADSATDEFDHVLTLGQLSAEEDALCEVDEAIYRILNGTYGVCEATGQPIPAARLKALPWTRFTREVEEHLERNGIVSGPHLGQVGSVRGTVIGSLEESESGGEEAEGNQANDKALEQVFTPSVKPERALRREANASARVAEGEFA